MSSESGVASQRENDANKERSSDGDVSDFTPFLLARILHGRVDHKSVMVTHESKCKDADCLQNSTIRETPGIRCPWTAIIFISHHHENLICNESYRLHTSRTVSSLAHQLTH